MILPIHIDFINYTVLGTRLINKINAVTREDKFFFSQNN